MHKPNGSVERALFDKKIIKVTDAPNRIELTLDDGSVVAFFEGLRRGADGGYYHEAIIAVDGCEIAWR